ncbi:MAG: acyltransferase family protein [Pirellulaceae bacterium]
MNTSVINADLSTSQLVAVTESTGAPTSSSDRRHDLDALRAVAMLLGIVLHSALSFAPIPWSVQDSQQSSFYYVLFACIHGFRMPLFFVLSGFFTAMLWRKRGLTSLIQHRFKRIFLPLFIGCFTIIPSMWAVGYLVSRPSPSAVPSSALFAAVVAGDVDSARSELQTANPRINDRDPASGATPLCTAVFLGHTELTELLISANADVNLPDRSLSSPLHIAVFMGRAEETAMLLKAGANVQARDGRHVTPQALLTTDFGTTNFIAGSLGVPVEEEALLAGRKEIANMLGTEEYLGSSNATAQEINLEGLKGLLFQLPVFMHLWFLSFLCWLVVAFLIYAPIAKALKIANLPRWLVCSPVSLLWLIPLTMIPQAFMAAPTFGPDSSVGLLPIPSVLIYYAVFFFFGALYWDMKDNAGQLGRWWMISLPSALLIVFPIGLEFTSGTFDFLPKLENESTHRVIGSFLQATYAWLMTFGSMGIFHHLLARENKTMRYISDSSYWLYLAHLPLVLLAQWLVQDLEIPAIVKFVTITVVISALLLVSYEYGVRYTWIGRLLNGPRTRPTRAA